MRGGVSSLSATSFACACSVFVGWVLADATSAWRVCRRLRRRWLGVGAALKAKVLAERQRDFCPAQSISYANTDPLLVVEGRGARLVDEAGRVFLDTRNNVAHVGHAHPAVAKAVAEQAMMLNTNTRYLHMNVCALARRLLDTMPAPLRDGVVFFVNSGSEANDLALRLARAATGHERVLVVDHAYHGHTVAALGLSPYKFEHRSFDGRGKPPWVTKCPAPDTYRGEHRGPHAAAAYARSVEEVCAEGPVAAFFIESGMSVAGVILPPAGYLARCYATVRAAGGVCVADEVGDPTTITATATTITAATATSISTATDTSISTAATTSGTAADATTTASAPPPPAPMFPSSAPRTARRPHRRAQVQTGLGRFGCCWWGFEQPAWLQVRPALRLPIAPSARPVASKAPTDSEAHSELGGLPWHGELASAGAEGEGSSPAAARQQGVVPDIVTMGKPMGNGMPLAAVVCTRARAFKVPPRGFT